MKLALTLILACSSALVSAQSHKTTDLDALHRDWMAPQISPKEDFYSYANHLWKISHPIPDDYASWGSFSILQEKNLIAIHQMVSAIAKDSSLKPGTIEQKVGDLYYSGMDMSTINRLGVKPLSQEFARIEAIQSKTELQAELAHFHQYGIDAGFSFMAMQDFNDSTKMIAALVQSGLSLPDRDYYLKTDKKFTDIRQAFTQHMQIMLQFLGDNSLHSKQEAETVMRIETELAKASLSQIEQRDPQAIYHVMSIDKLNALSPSIDWPGYLAARGMQNMSSLNVAMPEFIKRFDELLQSIDLKDWKIYLKWHLLDAVSSYLSQNFVDENFKMQSTLTGVKSLPPRWKQVLGTESGILGFAVGELYVEKHFSPEAKRQVMDMIAQIRSVLRQHLAKLSWMTESTRLAAIKKLDKMEERVGYPDKWWDYQSLSIDRGPYVWNVLRGSAFLVKRQLDKIGKPIDRTEWAMTPQTVNAYYDPSMNNINIPMGILQSPYFDPKAPLAVNYGGIGVVIGHEITHGFDDQGSKFDAEGNLHNWWTEEDAKQFKAATECISRQYSQFTVNDTVKVQGDLVVGEATADLGGLILAYRGLQANNAYAQQAPIQGFNPDQQFFLSFAHIWASNVRPEQALNLILVDPHPPAQYRVNGTLANFPEFSRVYQISEPSPMINQKICKVW